MTYVYARAACLVVIETSLGIWTIGRLMACPCTCKGRAKLIGMARRGRPEMAKKWKPNSLAAC